MPTFQYRALNPLGRKLRGTLSAQNEAELYYRLQQANLELVAASPLRTSPLARFRPNPVKGRDLIEVFVHLEQLEKVGVPILDSLNDLRESTENPVLRDVLTEVAQEVSGGKLLSAALHQFPRYFGTVVTGLIAAGERTGQMREAFGHVVHHLKWNESLQKRVKKALGYPLVMLAVSILMLGFMMVYLVPQLSEFLTTLELELPWYSSLLIELSGFISEWWPAVLTVPPAILFTILTLAKVNPAFGLQFDAFLYRIPMVGPTMRKIDLSRFSHFFAIMFQSGIPVLECIETARGVVGNRAMKRSLDVVRELVEGGSSLTAAIRSTGEFTNLVIRMVKIGEDTGNLKETLDNVAYFYDRDVEESIDAMVGSIQPVMTAVIGGLMAWVIAAVFLPVFDTFDDLPI